MDIRKKANTISLLILLLCIVIGIVIYVFTGVIFFALIFGPPIVHWILKKRERQSNSENGLGRDRRL